MRVMGSRININIMNKEKIKNIIKSAYDAGKNDSLAEEYLMKNAVSFMEAESFAGISEEEQNQIIETYRDGFLGKM